MRSALVAAVVVAALLPLGDTNQTTPSVESWGVRISDGAGPDGPVIPPQPSEPLPVPRLTAA
jgi:hypothetical protein